MTDLLLALTPPPECLHEACVGPFHLLSLLNATVGVSWLTRTKGRPLATEHSSSEGLDLESSSQGAHPSTLPETRRPRSPEEEAFSSHFFLRLLL